MAKYKKVGYYNGIDTLVFAKEEPDSVVKNFNRGVGAFHTTDDDEVIDNWIGKDVKVTNDGEYAVVYSVSNKFINSNIDDIPYADAEELMRDEFIDIYKRVE